MYLTIYDRGAVNFTNRAALYGCYWFCQLLMLWMNVLIHMNFWNYWKYYWVYARTNCWKMFSHSFSGLQTNTREHRSFPQNIFWKTSHFLEYFFSPKVLWVEENCFPSTSPSHGVCVLNFSNLAIWVGLGFFCFFNVWFYISH